MAFEEKDITRDREALVELVEKLHSRATPTVALGDEVVIGFDATRLEELLGRDRGD